MIGFTIPGKTMPPPRQRPARVVALLASAASLLGLSGCAALGASAPGYPGIDGGLWQALTSDPPPAAIRRAEAEHESLRRQGRFFAPTHPDVTSVQKLVDRLVAGSFKPGLELRAHVTRETTAEAFSTGGRHLYVSRGLLRRVRSGSELAFVLAHEIAHIHAAHRQRNAGRTRYARSDEAESDVLATRYTLRAGYDAVTGARFLERLRGEASAWPDAHPAPPRRTENIREAQRHFRGNPLGNALYGHTRRSLTTLDRLCQDAESGRIRVPSCAASPLPHVAAGARPTRDGIRALQRALGARGYACGAADGIMGPRTRGCIRAFQRDRGLPPTGLPDPATRRALALP